MDVQLPDGSLLRDVPEGTTRAQIEAKLGTTFDELAKNGGMRVNISADPKAQAEAAQMEADVAADRPSGLDNFLAGVNKGVVEPINHLASGLEAGANAIGVGDAINSLGNAIGLAPDTQAAEQEQQRQMQAAGVTPSLGGEIVGNIAATAPLAVERLGALGNGAVQGAVLSNRPSLGGKLFDAGVGAVTGAVGESATRGLANVIAPRVSQYVQQLTNEGVRLTPGQVARGASRENGSRLADFIANREDTMTSLPFVGRMIQEGRRQSVADLSRAQANRVLGPIGQQLPNDIPVGHRAVAHVGDAASDFYDESLRGMQFAPDGEFTQALGGLTQRIAEGGLDDAGVRQFQNTVRATVGRNLQRGGGQMDGRQLQSALSEIRRRATNFGTSASGNERELGQALGELADHLEDAAARQSPQEAVTAFQQAREAWSNLVPYELAAGKSTTGVPTPGQLDSAVRQANRSVRKRGYGRGEAVMQDLSEAARAILPSELGDSQTFTRAAAANLPANVLGYVASLGYRGARAATPLFTRETTNPYAINLGNYARQAAPYAARLASPAGISVPRLLVPPDNQ